MLPRLVPLALALLVCASAPAAGADDVAAGKALVERLECNRCHEVPGIPAPPQAKDCVRCHQDIQAGKFDAPPEAMKLWQKHIVDFLVAPSLATAGRRLERDWIVRFLQKPHDVRPQLSTTMPRLPLTAVQAGHIASYLTSFGRDRATVAAGGDAANGRKLMDANKCGTCHVFSGVAVLKTGGDGPNKAPTAAMKLATDLRFTRDRLSAAALVAWVKTPGGPGGSSLMPEFQLTDGQRRDIAAYILTTPLPAMPKVRIPKRLPILKRRVRFAEVAEKVLHHTCWHCHADADYARGDGGPGNTGGFGFPARQVNLATYGAVLSGGVNKAGQRESLFARDADGVPRLVAVLMARHAEVAGRPVPEISGMPMGLPPVALKNIQLIETWIAQGRPQ